MSLIKNVKPDRVNILITITPIIIQIIFQILAFLKIITCDTPYPFYCYIVNPVPLMQKTVILFLIWFFAGGVTTVFFKLLLPEDIAVLLGFFIPIYVIEIVCLYLFACFLVWFIKKIKEEKTKNKLRKSWLKTKKVDVLTLKFIKSKLKNLTKEWKKLKFKEKTGIIINFMGLIVNFLAFIVVLIGVILAVNELYVHTLELQEQTMQNAPHLASTSMCPILEPDKVNNYTAKLHNFGNSPAYYDIGYESENVSVRISNVKECFLFNDGCGEPSLEFWKTIPSDGEKRLEFQLKPHNESTFGFFVVVLEYKMEFLGKIRGDLQEFEPLISEIMGEKPARRLPEFEVERRKPILVDTFRLLDCEYVYDEETGFYLTDFQLDAKEQGLLDEYQEQVISESK